MSSAQGRGRHESVLQRRLTLEDLLDVPSFAEVVRSFSELYRVGLKVLDEHGAKLADVKVGNGDFCGYVFSLPEGRSRCTATVARVKEGPLAPTQSASPLRLPSPLGGELLSVPCFTGLRYLLMPVHWEGDVLGRVILGPFTPEELVDLPQTLTSIEGLEPARALEHLFKVRRAPERTVAQVLVHFGQLLVALLAAGHKAYLTSQVHIESTLETHRELEGQHAELRQLHQQLQETDRLKSSFLGTVSHELRTPLTSIIGYSEMLAEGLVGELNPEQAQYARTIMEKGDTLLRLISSILDMSQIEAGKVRLAFETVDVGELVSAAVSTLVPQAQRKGLTVEVRLPPDPPQGVADRQKLLQVLVNLLANAVKFTPSGGRVQVRVSELGPQPELGALGYRVDVEDNGEGIPAAHQARIFQSFYQVDSGPSRRHGGAGLGLAIVKAYVEGHGGQVLVVSEPGRGSCFTVVLPLHPPALSQSKPSIPPPITVPQPEPDRF
jgi:two-component system, NarL family, sensor histidine kinase BarA